MPPPPSSSWLSSSSRFPRLSTPSWMAALFCFFAFLACSPTVQAQEVVPSAPAIPVDRADLVPTIDAFTLRDKIPRFGAPASFPNPQNQDELDAYTAGLINVAVPGIVMICVTILWIIGFAVGRIFFDICCGGSKARPEGYGCRDRWGVFAACIVLSLVVVIFCSIGYSGNQNFHNALLGTKTQPGALNVATNLVSDAQEFLIDVQAPLLAVSDGIDNFFASSTVQTIFSSLDTAQNGITNVNNTGLADNVEAFGTKWEDRRIQATGSGGAFNDPVSGQPFFWECIACVGLTAQTDPVAQDLRNQTAKTRADIADSNAIVDDIVVVSRANIQSSIVEAISSLETGLEFVTNETDFINESVDTLDSWEGYRYTFYVLLFIFPLLMFALAMFGAPVFKANYFFGFGVLLTFWALLGFHLPVAVVFADVCIWVDGQENSDFGQAFTVPETQTLASACLTNATISEVYNLTEQLRYSERFVSFPPKPFFVIPAKTRFSVVDQQIPQFNETELTQASNFSSFTAQIDTLNTYTTRDSLFYTRTAAEIVFLSGADYLNDPALHRDNISTADCTGAILQVECDAHLTFTRELLVAETNNNLETRALFAEFGQDVADLERQAGEVGVSIQNLNARYTGLKAQVETIISTQVRRFERESTCFFIGQAYRNMKLTFCGPMSTADYDQIVSVDGEEAERDPSMLEGLGNIVLALLIIGLMTVLIVISSIWLSKALPHDRIDADADTDSDDELDEFD